MMREPHLAPFAFAVAIALTAAAKPPVTPAGPLSERNGWTYVTFSDETVVYMRPRVAAKTPNAKQAWTAYDSPRTRNRDGFAFKSVASLGEYDCAKQLTRVVFESFHEQRDLGGRKWSQPDFHPTEWNNPAKGTVGEQRMAFVCETDKV